MARKGSTDASKKKFTWRGFYNHSLTDAEKSAIKAMLTGKDKFSLESAIVELANSGYKISYAYNHTNDSITASATGNDRSKNSGYTLTIAHSDVRTATFAVYLVISEVYAWNEWPTEQGDDIDW